MASPNSVTIDYDQVNAVSRRYFVPKLYDNIFLGHPLMRRAKSKGWYRKIPGGTNVVIPLEYAILSASGSYAGAQTLDTSDNNVFTAASYDWKQYYASITISRIDELKNGGGTTQVVNFVKSKMKNSEKTLRRRLGSSTGLYSDGSVATELVGLVAHVDTDQTIGGISQSTNSWWQAQEDASTTSLTLPAMQTRYNACCEDEEKPTVITTTKSIYNTFWGLLTPQQRFTSDGEAKAGFQSLMFNGIPVIADTNCPSGDMYFLNEDHLHWLVHEDEDMRFSDFSKPENQNVKVGQIFWAGIFGSSNNRYHGAFKAITG
jgi:hypothetical protein